MFISCQIKNSLLKFSKNLQDILITQSSLTMIFFTELQKEVDRMAKEARQIDNLLQETNWKTSLKE